MQTLPPLRNDPIKKWLHMVRNVLNRTRLWIKFFSDFYFSSNHRKLGWFFQKNDTKMTITQKIKIVKIWKLVLLSNQPISNLPCKFQKFQKKKNFASLFRSYVVSELARFARGRIEDSSITGSRSTAFQNCLLHCFSA